MTVRIDNYNFGDSRLVGTAKASDGTIQPFVINFTQAQLRDLRAKRHRSDLQETANAFVATMGRWLQNQEDLIERIKQENIEDIIAEFLEFEDLADQSE